MRDHLGACVGVLQASMVQVAGDCNSAGTRLVSSSLLGGMSGASCATPSHWSAQLAWRLFEQVLGPASMAGSGGQFR